MSKVTKIESQKKRQGRFNIYIDDKFEVGISEKDLLDAGISNNREISEEDIKKLKEKSLETKARDKALRFLSIRPRSIAEIKKKLEEKKYTPKIIRKTIVWLKKEELLNDKKFAKMWVQNRKNFHPLGKFRLSLELRKKQVPLKIIEKEISGIKEKQEVKEAKELAKKRVKLYKDQDKYKKREKIIAFLQRRGYGWDVIKGAIEKITF